MQVFSSDVYFTVGTNALLASQKEYYSDLVALVDLGHSFVVIDEHQHRNLKPNTKPVNILLSNNFIRLNKNITLSDLTHFLVSNLHTQNVYSTQEPLTHDEIDILRLCVSYSLKQIAIIKGIDYKTISYHKIRALNKLNIKGTV
ncbi:LuxR family transcriptional regulator [Escherichia coli]|nr:LuxR family transcriptional regulator [Escherichia coli]